MESATGKSLVRTAWQCQALEKVLSAFERKPELAQLIGRLVPQTVVGGDANWAGAAAIIGQAISGQSRDNAAAALPPGTR